MSEAPDVVSADEESKRRTLGEELFLVHLSRQTEVSAEDFDHEANNQQHQRERGASVGEELWHVHCKRAAGHLDEDYEEQEATVGTPEKKKQTKDPPETSPCSGNNEEKVIHLRNRDIKIP